MTEAHLCASEVPEMTSDGDQPKPSRLPVIEETANAARLPAIDGAKAQENKVIDVITGKIHDLPEHSLMPVDERK